eukprot:583884-Amphidinium_carterae.1
MQRLEEKSRNEYVSPLKVFHTLVKTKNGGSARAKAQWRSNASSPNAKESSIDAAKLPPQKRKYQKNSSKIGSTAGLAIVSARHRETCSMAYCKRVLARTSEAARK